MAGGMWKRGKRSWLRTRCCEPFELVRKLEQVFGFCLARSRKAQVAGDVRQPNANFGGGIARAL